MSALDLTIDSVFNAAACGITEAPRTRYGGIVHLIRSVFISKKPITRNIPAGGTDYSAARVFSNLRDFLQPDTKLSLQEAAESILVLIPANTSGNAEVCSFGGICVELAEQIPYDHPSQLKFTQLLHYLSMSPEFMYKYPVALLWESFSESLSAPDADNPTMWVDLHALMAKLFSTGIWGTSPGYAIEMLREAFESETPEEVWERDRNIMAAAQWTLWHGQTLFKLVIFDGFEGDANDKGNWWVGKAFAGPQIEPRSIDRWRFWKAGFEAVEKDSDASDDCKSIAKRAARIMTSLEDAMVF